MILEPLTVLIFHGLIVFAILATFLSEDKRKNKKLSWTLYFFALFFLAYTIIAFCYWIGVL